MRLSSNCPRFTKVDPTSNLPLAYRYRNRALLISGVAALTAVFNWTYVSWLSPVYGYSGFTYNQPSLGYLVIASMLSLAPSFWMPNVLNRPSQLIYWILYLTAFIPSMFVPLYVALQPPIEALWLMVAMFGGFVLIGLGYRLPLKRPRFVPNCSHVLFWGSLAFGSLSLFGWVLYSFGGNLQFVSFERVYDVRLDAMELTTNQLSGYGIMWLSGAINPFLMAWGFCNKKRFVLLTGMLSQALLYGTTAAKIVVLSTGVVPLFYLALSGKNSSFGLKMIWGTVALFVAINCVDIGWGGEPDEIGFWPSALLFMRTFGIPGLSTAIYHDFFSDHPLTYWSHVKGINLFVPYPYDRPVHMVVGHFMSGDETLSANANLWCQDGLAALGLPGILVASVFCVMIFWVLDSAAQGHDIRLTGPLVSFAAINISNISLFTSMLSGGLFLIIVILLFLPRERAVVPERANKVPSTISNE